MFTRRVKRYVIAASVVALLVAAYAAVGFFAVPHLLRSNLRSFVSSHYGRAVSIGDIHFNPFTFTLDVADFSLPDTDGQTMLGFGQLHVDLQVASLWRLGPSFRAIVLERPLVHTVVRPDGTLNLADLGKGFASTAPAPKPAPNAQPMRLFIDRFAVIAGSGTFEDRTRSTPFRAELQPIAFELHQFSTRAKTGNDYSLTAASSQGERLDWNGSILLEPLSSHGTFEITSLQASTIWSYLQQPLPLEVPSGTIGLRGDYDFHLAGDAAPAITIDVHDTAVADLKLRPRGGTADYVSLTKVDIQETRVDVAKHTVEIGKVALTGGEVTAWVDANGRLNLLELAAPESGSAPAVAANQGASASAPNSASGPGDSAAANASAAAPGTPAPGASATAPTVTTSGSAPVWTVSVPDIAVEGLKVSTEDRQVTPAIALVFNPLSIHVAGFNTTPEARLDITAKTSINSTASLDATAQLTPHSGDMSAHVELARLDLATFQPIIAQRTAMTLQSGRLATKLDIQHPADGSLAVKGEAQISNLRTVDNDLKQSFIKWKDLRVTGIEYGSQPANLRIASIVAREPYARVIIAKNRSVNVSEVLAGPNKSASGQHEATDGKSASATLIDANGANANGTDAKIAEGMVAGAKDTGAKSADAAVAGGKDAGTSKQGRHSRKTLATAAVHGALAVAQGDSSAMPMAIGKVQIINGSANYADFWIQPNFAVGIQTLNGSIDGLSSNPKSRAKVQLEGKVDRYAPVHIGGEMNLLAATVYTDVTMSFKGLELTTMTPYSGRFAGYKIDKGKLSVDLSYKVDQRKLVAEQRFVIDQLQLGDPVDSPDAVHLPLKLAVALLKDRNGVIDLPLPITGSLDDPQFKLGPIIWKAVVNLLVKVATAPFALLGHLFGGGEEMNFIDFPAGSAEVDDAAKQKLTGLTKALQERPQLNLDVPIVYSTQIDRPVLAAKVLRGKLLARERTDHPQKKGERPPKGKGTDATQVADDDKVAGATKVADATKSADAAKTPDAAKGLSAGKGSDGAKTADSQNGADSTRDPALANPLEHYRLLLAEYQAELGKDAELPPSAQAIQTAKNKKDTPPVESAIPDLEAALIAHIQVPEVELQELGKKRTQAIQDALLTEGGIDGSRVFVINGSPKSDSGDKVRVEMSLK